MSKLRSSPNMNGYVAATWKTVSRNVSPSSHFDKSPCSSEIRRIEVRMQTAEMLELGSHPSRRRRSPTIPFCPLRRRGSSTAKAFRISPGCTFGTRPGPKSQSVIERVRHLLNLHVPNHSALSVVAWIVAGKRRLRKSGLSGANCSGHDVLLGADHLR
jgi:hypothetical protein